MERQSRERSKEGQRLRPAEFQYSEDGKKTGNQFRLKRDDQMGGK